VRLANHVPVVAGCGLDAAKPYLLLRGAKIRYLTAAEVREQQE
jgi:hypothetical protein